MVRTGFFLAITVFLFGSCRSTKVIQTAIAKKDTVAAVITPPMNNAKEDSITFIKNNYTKIMDNRINVTTFSAKVEVDYTDAEGKKYNVNAHRNLFYCFIVFVSDHQISPSI